MDKLIHVIKNTIHDEIEPLRKMIGELTLNQNTTEKSKDNICEELQLASSVENQILNQVVLL